MPFTARIERAPFHRARSASKKGTWPFPSSSFGGRALREHRDHQAPSPPLFREQRDALAVRPPPLLGGFHAVQNFAHFLRQHVG